MKKQPAMMNPVAEMNGAVEPDEDDQQPATKPISLNSLKSALAQRRKPKKPSPLAMMMATKGKGQ